MKKYIFILMMLVAGFTACEAPGTQHQNVEQVTVIQEQQPPTVRLVCIADRTGSFIKQYAHPDPQLFKPLCDKIIRDENSLDFRYGCITSNSNVVFDRYYVPYVPKAVIQKAANPWLETEQAPAEPEKQPGDWNSFAESINTKLAASPSNSSDVASAISRAIVIFQENGSYTRNILVLCTDGLDSYRELPTVPQDIEVITVGISNDNHIEQVLNTTNIKRFENLHAAIDYLNSQSYTN